VPEPTYQGRFTEADSPRHRSSVPGDELAGGAVVREEGEADGAGCSLGRVLALGGGPVVEVGPPQAGSERVDLEAVLGECLGENRVSAFRAVLEER
jgi:hypothetical protein